MDCLITIQQGIESSKVTQVTNFEFYKRTNLKINYLIVFREYFGLSKIKTFNEINPDLFENNPDLLQKLIQIYDGKLDNIDVYIGKFYSVTYLLKNTFHHI